MTITEALRITRNVPREAPPFAVILVCKYVVVCLLLNKIVLGEEALKAFTLYDFLWCAVAGRWAYRVASGGLF